MPQRKIMDPQAIRLLALIMLACVSIVPGTAKAGICWVTSVDKSGAGIVVHFASRRFVRLVHPDMTGEDFFVDPAATDPSTTQNGVKIVNSLLLAPGEKFLSHNGPEDSCSAAVATIDGQIGLQASAALHLPGTQGESVKDFMLAR